MTNKNENEDIIHGTWPDAQALLVGRKDAAASVLASSWSLRIPRAPVPLQALPITSTVWPITTCSSEKQSKGSRFVQVS